MNTKIITSGLSLVSIFIVMVGGGVLLTSAITAYGLIRGLEFMKLEYEWTEGLRYRDSKKYYDFAGRMLDLYFGFNYNYKPGEWYERVRSDLR